MGGNDKVCKIVASVNGGYTGDWRGSHNRAWRETGEVPPK